MDFGSIFFNIGAFLLLIAVVVIVHEFGHYMAARACGVAVEVFSFGMGPRLFGKKAYGTDWRVSLLPMGGYVRMEQETPTEDASSKPLSPTSFQAKPRWQRLIIVLAGPGINFVLAFAMLLPIYWRGIEQPEAFYREAVTRGVMVDDKLSDLVVSGDIIRSINGKTVRNWKDVMYETAIAGATETPILALVLERGDRMLTATFDGNGGKTRIRLLPLYTGTVVLGTSFTEAWRQAWREMGEAITMQLDSLKRIVTGSIPAKSVDGPVGIATVSGQILRESRTEGWVPFLRWIAFISVILGLMNLIFPIPMLDGGLAVLLIGQMIVRKDLSARATHVLGVISFMLIVLLTIMIIGNDIIKRL